MEKYYMTKKDIKRCGILEEVVKGKYTIAEASRLLNISRRQVQRLKMQNLMN